MKLNLLEYDLVGHQSLNADVNALLEGKGIILLQCQQAIRVLTIIKEEGKPQILRLVDILRSRDPIWDDDILLSDVRYSTRSGIVTRWEGELGASLKVLVKEVYDRFLRKPKVVGGWRHKNRITEYLDKPDSLG